MICKTYRSVIRAILIAFCISQLPETTSAQEQNICIEPVFNDPATMLQVEVQQPYRLVGSHGVNILEDYPGLILHPVNRGGFYTVRDGEYRKLPKHLSSRLGRWGVSKREAEPTFGTEGMPPGFTRNDMQPVFYSELGLFLARSGDSIWFRKSENEEWEKYAGASWFGFSARDMGGSWEKPEVWRNPNNGLVAMTLNATLLLIGHQPDIGEDLTFKYHAFRAGSFVSPIFHKGTGNMLFWDSDNRLSRADIDGPTLMDTPWPQPQNPSSRNVESWKTPRFSQTDPISGDVLFRHFSGMARFDGQKVTDIEAWRTDRLSRYTTLVWIDGRRYARNSEGLFRVGDDLELSEIDLPFGKQGAQFHLFTKYEKSSGFNLVFLINGRDGRVFTTRDFSSYREVRNDTGVAITGFVSDIPNESSSLLIGKDGLYAAVYCED